MYALSLLTIFCFVSIVASSSLLCVSTTGVSGQQYPVNFSCNTTDGVLDITASSIPDGYSSVKVDHVAPGCSVVVHDLSVSRFQLHRGLPAGASLQILNMACTESGNSGALQRPVCINFEIGSPANRFITNASFILIRNVTWRSLVKYHPTFGTLYLVNLQQPILSLRGNFTVEDCILEAAINDQSSTPTWIQTTSLPFMIVGFFEPVINMTGSIVIRRNQVIADVRIKPAISLQILAFVGSRPSVGWHHCVDGVAGGIMITHNKIVVNRLYSSERHCWVRILEPFEDLVNVSGPGIDVSSNEIVLNGNIDPAKEYVIVSFFSKSISAVRIHIVDGGWLRINNNSISYANNNARLRPGSESSAFFSADALFMSPANVRVNRGGLELTGNSIDIYVTDTSDTNSESTRFVSIARMITDNVTGETFAAGIFASNNTVTVRGNAKRSATFGILVFSRAAVRFVPVIELSNNLVAATYFHCDDTTTMTSKPLLSLVQLLTVGCGVDHVDRISVRDSTTLLAEGWSYGDVGALLISIQGISVSSTFTVTSSSVRAWAPGRYPMWGRTGVDFTGVSIGEASSGGGGFFLDNVSLVTDSKSYNGGNVFFLMLRLSKEFTNCGPISVTNSLIDVGEYSSTSSGRGYKSSNYVFARFVFLYSDVIFAARKTAVANAGPPLLRVENCTTLLQIAPQYYSYAIAISARRKLYGGTIPITSSNSKEYGRNADLLVSNFTVFMRTTTFDPDSVAVYSLWIETGGDLDDWRSATVRNVHVTLDPRDAGRGFFAAGFRFTGRLGNDVDLVTVDGWTVTADTASSTLNNGGQARYLDAISLDDPYGMPRGSTASGSTLSMALGLGATTFVVRNVFVCVRNRYVYSPGKATTAKLRSNAFVSTNRLIGDGTKAMRITIENCHFDVRGFGDTATAELAFVNFVYTMTNGLDVNGVHSISVSNSSIFLLVNSTWYSGAQTLLARASGLFANNGLIGIDSIALSNISLSISTAQMTTVGDARFLDLRQRAAVAQLHQRLQFSVVDSSINYVSSILDAAATKQFAWMQAGYNSIDLPPTSASRKVVLLLYAISLESCRACNFTMRRCAVRAGRFADVLAMTPQLLAKGATSVSGAFRDGTRFDFADLKVTALDLNLRGGSLWLHLFYLPLTSAGSAPTAAASGDDDVHPEVSVSIRNVEAVIHNVTAGSLQIYFFEAPQPCLSASTSGNRISLSDIVADDEFTIALANVARSSVVAAGASGFVRGVSLRVQNCRSKASIASASFTIAALAVGSLFSFYQYGDLPEIDLYNTRFVVSDCSIEVDSLTATTSCNPSLCAALLLSPYSLAERVREFALSNVSVSVFLSSSLSVQNAQNLVSLVALHPQSLNDSISAAPPKLLPFMSRVNFTLRDCNSALPRSAPADAFIRSLVNISNTVGGSSNNNGIVNSLNHTSWNFICNAWPNHVVREFAKRFGSTVRVTQQCSHTASLSLTQTVSAEDSTSYSAATATRNASDTRGRLTESKSIELTATNTSAMLSETNSGAFVSRSKSRNTQSLSHKTQSSSATKPIIQRPQPPTFVTASLLAMAGISIIVLSASPRLFTYGRNLVAMTRLAGESCPLDDIRQLPDAEVDANPLGLAIGSDVLATHRGSVVGAVILFSGAALLCLATALILKVVDGRRLQRLLAERAREHRKKSERKRAALKSTEERTQFDAKCEQRSRQQRKEDKKKNQFPFAKALRLLRLPGWLLAVPMAVVGPSGVIATATLWAAGAAVSDLVSDDATPLATTNLCAAAGVILFVVLPVATYSYVGWNRARDEVLMDEEETQDINHHDATKTSSNNLTKLLSWLISPRRAWRSLSKVFRSWGAVYDAHAVPYFAAVEYVLQAGVSAVGGLVVSCRSEACCETSGAVGALLVGINLALLLFLRRPYLYLSRLESAFNIVMTAATLFVIVIGLMSRKGDDEDGSKQRKVELVAYASLCLGLLLSLFPILQSVVTASKWIGERVMPCVDESAQQQQQQQGRQKPRKQRAVQTELEHQQELVVSPMSLTMMMSKISGAGWDDHDVPLLLETGVATSKARRCASILRTAAAAAAEESDTEMKERADVTQDKHLSATTTTF